MSNNSLPGHVPTLSTQTHMPQPGSLHVSQSHHQHFVHLLRRAVVDAATSSTQVLGCEASLLATDWYLCLFATSLPAESAARVWDCLLLEGRKVLHRLGLALLAKAAPLLMQLDNAGMCVYGGGGGRLLGTWFCALYRMTACKAAF
jgi:hypothetical protein